MVEDVLIDAELCRRLHTRGSVAGADGISDLWKALDLVRGVPLDQRREGGYEWLVDTPLDIEYLAMIVDISSKVVTHELARGDTAAAIRAAHDPGQGRQQRRHRAAEPDESSRRGRRTRARRRLRAANPGQLRRRRRGRSAAAYRGDPPPPKVRITTTVTLRTRKRWAAQ